MRPLTEEFRLLVSEGSDLGMQMAADGLEDSDDPTTQKVGRLLRLYVDIQTYVRMSLPIPLSMADEYQKLNESFTTRQTKFVDGTYRGTYSQPLGSFYTKLTCTLQDINNNPNLLSEEPVRILVVHDASVGADLASLLRNYRFDYLQDVEINFNRRTNQCNPLMTAVSEMMGNQMRRFAIRGLDDRLKIVQTAFIMNRKIASGCSFWTSRYPHGSVERMCQKK